ncbi:MAG: hypothetical protein M3014_01230, partial [Chloroflexota bacterium]|nr:hypothetical protein [Chloroflexota bacterium]
LYVGLHALIISLLSGLGPISRHEWGQRYLLPAYPALIVLSLLAGTNTWRIIKDSYSKNTARLFLSIGLLLSLMGAGFSVRGYVALYSERTQVVSWINLTRSLPGREPLVTDTWWLPLNLAADFYSRPIMLAEGNERLAKWAIDMRSIGVQNFGLMTGDQALFGGKWISNVPGLHSDGGPQEARGMWLQRYTLDPR